MRKFLFVAFSMVTAAFVVGGISYFRSTAFAAAAQTQSSAASNASLQSQIDANNAAVAQLNAEIAQYEAEIKKAGSDKATLQAAINSLDLQRSKLEAQISATQRQINTTQLQINQIGSNIDDTQQSISDSQAALGADLRNLQIASGKPLVAQLLSSESFSDAWNTVDSDIQIQQAIQAKVQTLQSQVDALNVSKAQSQEKQDTLTSQKKNLTSQQASLVQTENSKSTLLKQTNAKESNYEKLLAQAKAELQSFSTFAQNAGGTGLLTNQTKCDDWGCYYNQRDSAWGNTPLNGTQYTMKADGCLVTAMAMVLTHYGYRDVTPMTINANPANFASYYPALLLTTITVDGKSVTRVATTIDAALAQGTPVIVGLNAYGGTHFVVLVSGSKGNYIMRDPYVANGDDITFSSHYKMSQIYVIRKVQVS